MKLFKYALISTAAACVLPATAETAYTSPVGYVTLSVPAESDSVLGPCLNRASALETTAVSATGLTITIKASGLAANAFKYSPVTSPQTIPLQTNHYYLQIRSGTFAGQYVPIVTNSASSDGGTPGDTSDDTTVFTLEEAVSITGTPRVGVVPFWTFDTFFPGGKGVGTQPDPGNTDQIVTFYKQTDVGANLGTDGDYTFSYYDGSQGGDAGWYSVITGNPAGDQVIDNNQMMLVRNSSLVAREVVLTGEIQQETITSAVYKEAVVQDNANIIRYPVDTALADAGLCKATPDGLGGYTFSGPVSPIADPGDTTGDSVLVFDYYTAGEDGTDIATGFNFNASKTYVFYDGSQGGSPEWYSVDTGTPANPMLKAGRGLFIRKAQGTVTALPWSRTMPYTMP